VKTSILRVEYEKHDITARGRGKPGDWLTGKFRLYRKQEENGRVDLSAHWIAITQNETAGLSHDQHSRYDEEMVSQFIS
jgi:hypothetical protein